MEIRIGKLETDGTVRHILLEYADEKTIPLLLTFYSRESRLNALIELGNLERLFGTPYGKNTGYDDTVHCRAQIRDNGAKKIRNQYEVEENTRDYAKLNGCVLLYAQGVWYSLQNNNCERLSPQSRLNEASPAYPFDGIRLYMPDPENGGLDTISIQDFNSWDDLHAWTEINDAPIFVFRDNKLIATIHSNQ